MSVLIFFVYLDFEQISELARLRKFSFPGGHNLGLTAIPDAFLVSKMNHHVLLLSDFTGVQR